MLIWVPLLLQIQQPPVARPFADWLELLGSYVAVLVALLIAVYGYQLSRMFRRPRLSVSIDINDRDDCHKTYRYAPTSTAQNGTRRPSWASPQALRQAEIDDASGTAAANYNSSPEVVLGSWDSSGPPSSRRERYQGERVDVYYLRLRIENAGNERAEKVEVYAGELRRRQVDGQTTRPVHAFQSINLLWSHYRTVFLDAISPHTSKHCDLCHISDPRNAGLVGEDGFEGYEARKTALVFDTAVRPNNKGNMVSPGVYELDLTVAAANAKPERVTVEITLTGQWYDDENTMLGDKGVSARVLNRPDRKRR